MEELYDSLPEGPRFIYLLTYQNHGGYDQNDSSLDLVHALNDFGWLDGRIDEYLTTISMSADAFVDLTELFRLLDRPTIIFMVGDHAPSFISDMPPKAGMSDDERNIAILSVPYAAWSNFDMDWPENTGEISMVDIGPLIKQAAGLPVSTYDEQLLRLQKTAPIRVSSGYCKMADGSITEYDPKGNRQIDAMLRDYYYMEYNLLNGGEEFRTELFETGQ